MGKHRNKIIVAVIAVAVLAGTWLWGSAPEVNVVGAAPGTGLAAMEVNIPPSAAGDVVAEMRHRPGADVNLGVGESPEDEDEGDEDAADAESGESLGSEAQDTEDAESNEQSESNEQVENESEDVTDAEPYEPAENEAGETAGVETYETTESSGYTEQSGYGEADASYTATYTDTEEEAESTPDEMQPSETQTEPEEPEQPPGPDPYVIQIAGDYHPNMGDLAQPNDMVVEDDEYFTVTMSIRVNSLLHNMHLLDSAKHELVPADGFIFPPTQVRVYPGESVFNILQRETRRNNIHMVSQFTPVFNSAHTRAINNLFSRDAGPLSGWMYRVNGWFPNFGSSLYVLSPGDVVEWVFTVDLGRDYGAYWVGEDFFSYTGYEDSHE